MHLTETSYNHIWTVGCLYAAGSAGLPTAILLMSLFLSHLSASAVAGSLSFRCAPSLSQSFVLGHPQKQVHLYCEVGGGCEGCR